MNKKFLSTILAGACALSCMSFAAFAEAKFTAGDQDDTEIESSGDHDLTTDAGFIAPTLSVTVPTSITAILNPYGVEVELEDGNKTGKAGITSPVYTITNNTEDFGIEVTAKTAITKVTAKTTTNAIKVATSADAEAATSRQVYAEVLASVSTETALAKRVAFMDSTADENKDKTSDGVLFTLAKVEGTGKNATVAAGYFQIGGKLIDATTAVGWEEGDSVQLKLILNIAPKADAETAIGT